VYGSHWEPVKSDKDNKFTEELRSVYCHSVIDRIPGWDSAPDAKFSDERLAAKEHPELRGGIASGFGRLREERDFILRLNGLSKALTAFVETYKSGRVDLKGVKALQKAMRDLEKSEWFRPPKAK
jgi:hypothetical protein